MNCRLCKKSIDYVVGKLKSTTEAEQDFYRLTIANLQAEYNKIDDRISKMFDEKMDSSITAEIYDKKLREYKAKQFDITQQIQEHSKADESHYLTASKLLDICKRAKNLFDISEPNEKRQLLNFVFQNCRLRGNEPIFTPKPVFAGIVSAHKMLIGSPPVRRLERGLPRFTVDERGRLRTLEKFGEPAKITH